MEASLCIWKHFFRETIIIEQKEFTINRSLLKAELVLDKIKVTSKSRHIKEIPYRSKPLCFELNNSLYIAGHVPCDNCHSEHRILIEDHYSHVDKNDCKCCDRFDLSNDKYHRNVHFMPLSLKRVIQPKIVTDKHEAFAVISFYDPLDFQKKIWTFTEYAGFAEHSDLVSDVCNGCKVYADTKPFAEIRSDTHHPYCDLRYLPLPIERQLLRIK